uniref:EF-hand domain-containing protein n=2 Tax=Aegilops tauschii subsp. strangulata TaxID=200361 RepID=A0A453J2I3_AEGTS
RMYDFDRNGTMSFQEFLALNKFLQKVQGVFSTLERGRGFLSLEDVYEALIKLGFSLDSPAFYTVCESFDKSKKGMVRLDEFISICIFVQSARNLYSSFDTTKQGKVTLDFNQFVYCSEFQPPCIYTTAYISCSSESRQPYYSSKTDERFYHPCSLTCIFPHISTAANCRI